MGISLGSVVAHLDPRPDTTDLMALVGRLEISLAEISDRTADDRLYGLLLPSKYYELQPALEFLCHVFDKPVLRGGLIGALAGAGAAALSGQDVVLYGFIGFALGYAADAIPYWVRVMFYLNKHSVKYSP